MQGTMEGASGEEQETTPVEVPGLDARASLQEMRRIEAVLENWVVTCHHARIDQVQKLKECLNEEFLLSLYKPAANHFWLANPDGKSWRYLFRRQCFRILGVHDRIPEGHPSGLPPTVSPTIFFVIFHCY